MADSNAHRPNDSFPRGKRDVEQPAREASRECHEDKEFGVEPPEDVPPAPLPIREEAEESQQASFTAYELEQRQLSLGGLLVIVTAISVLLAPISFLPIKVYTAVLGGLVLLLFIISALMGAKELIVRVTLWVLLAVYLITLFIACKDQLGF